MGIGTRAALLLAAAAAAGLWCAPTATSDPCASETAAFADLPATYAVRHVCPADIGLAGFQTQLADPAAVVITKTDYDPDAEVLKVVVGKSNSGDGAQLVDAYLTGLGETRDDTVVLDGRTVRYFNAGGVEGYAYSDGPTVVIGYIPPPFAQLAATQEPAKDAFARVVATVAGTPVPADTRIDVDTESYAPGRGVYTSPANPGWIFFTTDGEKGAPLIHCGIAPDGLMAGCDLVPPEAPQGTNQTVVDATGPARYVASDAATFTRETGVLLPGHRIVSGAATCAVGYQGTVNCRVGAHRFVVGSQYGVLE